AYNEAIVMHPYPPGGEGGGIAHWGTLTITNSTIIGNIAGGWPPFPVSFGGGIRSNGPVYILNSSIINNIALEGGGVYGGGIYLTNSTVSGNHGDGVFNNGTLTLTNSTIANNLTGGGSAGVYNAGRVVAHNT